MKLELKKGNNDYKIQCYKVNFKYTIKYFDVCQKFCKISVHNNTNVRSGQFSTYFNLSL